MNQPEPSPQSQTLSRELSVFLVQLSIGLHKFATYPSNHPVVKEAVESVYLQLLALLSERDMLALGVARKQLIVEGAATDPDSAVLAELAQRLHRHQVGAIRLQDGIMVDELKDLLATLGREANREEVPFGLRPSEELDRWQHIQVVPLTFDQLQLADGESAGEGGQADIRQSQLWLGLAAAAMHTDMDDAGSGHQDPSSVAKAIKDQKGDRTYDQVIVGYLSQLGRELKLREGAEAKVLHDQVTQLLESLDQKTLQRLLEVGGNRETRNRMLSDFTANLPVQAVMDLVKAASESNEQTISHSLLRMLSKLADHAEQDTGVLGPRADEHFRDSVHSLLDGWSLEDPNPEAYTEVLQRLANAGEQDSPTDVADPTEEASRIVQMAMELDVIGPVVTHAIDTMLELGRFKELLELLDNAPPESTGPAETWDYLASPERVRLLLAHDEHDVEGVQRVLERLGDEAAEPLIDALATAASRAMRHRLLSTLTALGPTVGPVAVKYLPEAEWYVKRNLLILLGSLSEWPEGFLPEPYAKHADARVRREALKLMLQADDTAMREEGILLGVADDDDSIIRMALTAAIDSCPTEAHRHVLRLMENEDSDIRVLAIRVVGGFDTPRARTLLLDRALGKRKWWQRRRRLAGTSPEMLAALAALASAWADVPEVKEVINLARRSSNQEVRTVIGAA